MATLSNAFILLEKIHTSMAGKYKKKSISLGTQASTEIKASGGLQECAGDDSTEADAYFVAGVQGICEGLYGR